MYLLSYMTIISAVQSQMNNHIVSSTPALNTPSKPRVMDPGYYRYKRDYVCGQPPNTVMNTLTTQIYSHFRWYGHVRIVLTVKSRPSDGENEDTRFVRKCVVDPQGGESGVRHDTRSDLRVPWEKVII